jgi:hypothetical protein
MLLESGGGTWVTALYTVKGVGSGSRDVLQVPMTLDHVPVTSNGKSAPGPDVRIRYRIQIACFGLSEWTTLIVYKWLLKLIHSYFAQDGLLKM